MGGSAHLTRRADRTVRRLPDQPLDHDRVLPLPLKPPMPAVNAYLAEAARPGEREAGRVLGEYPAQELVVAAPLGLGRERLEQGAADTAPARRARDVDGVLADAVVHAPVAVLAGARPPEHLAVVLGDDKRRRAVAGPPEDVLGRARRGLEGGDAVLDPLVVDGRDGGGVGGLPAAHDHARTVAALRRRRRAAPTARRGALREGQAPPPGHPSSSPIDESATGLGSYGYGEFSA